MRLSKPDDDPNEPVGETRGPTTDAVMTETKVDPGRDPIPLIDAVEEHNERIREVEKMAMENQKLRSRVDELEAMVDRLRADVAALYAARETGPQGRHIVVSEDDEHAWAPESVDMYDPLGEFEG